ncbi:MAG: hypothetical protein PUJ55_13440 [Clostridiales bacterium]|nr:hypothetical protein [Roseburia sp.]MDD7637925.1 hypothetical protein [Clostridiales bacterium]MDY4113756.1 hypothetical protein [Roseburia sp.]
MEDAQFLTELYDIIRQHGDEGYENIISEKSSYPYLYHLSGIRQNLIDWIPMNKDMCVLERNPECGALTGKLLEKAGAVTCVAEDAQRAGIIKARNETTEGTLTILSEPDFLTASCLEKYDVILIVGSFYRFKEELVRLRQQLKPNGRLIVADANRLGLKFFAGCREEYRGTYFSGVEGYENEQDIVVSPRCYTKGEYTKCLKEAGFAECKFYYPYPDYKFPNCIYSDEWLPREGELMDNRRNFEGDRLQFFDERKVYDTFLKEGVFETFSNSYLIEAYV